MASKAKVTLSLDTELLAQLAALSKERNVSRSRLVEEALRVRAPGLSGCASSI